MKIFDNIMVELEILRTNVRGIINDLKRIDRNVCNTSSRDRLISDQSETIKKQSKIINDLINNIYSQDTSLDAVMIKPYRSNPIIYKDGKRLDTDKMTGFNIDWNYDSRIDISVRNE